MQKWFQMIWYSNLLNVHDLFRTHETKFYEKIYVLKNEKWKIMVNHNN